MSLEEKILDHIQLYETEGKKQVSSTSGKNNFWYKNVHQHFEKIIIPHINKSKENFVEYYPVYFSYGETTGYRQGISSGKLYRHTYGTYGTGYICFTNKNIYITALDSLTKEYPLFEGGSKGFLVTILEGLQGERNDRNPYKGDNTWGIDYPSIVGAQITQVEGSSEEVVYIKTTSVDWHIYQHFTDTLQEILTILKMGKSSKLANVWSKKETTSDSDVPSLLKKLSELKEAGIITESEFQQKKQKLLNQI